MPRPKLLLFCPVVALVGGMLENLVLVEALLTPLVQDIEGARPISDGYEYCNRPRPWETHLPACLRIDMLGPIPDQTQRAQWSLVTNCTSGSPFV